MCRVAVYVYIQHNMFWSRFLTRSSISSSVASESESHITFNDVGKATGTHGSFMSLYIPVEHFFWTRMQRSRRCWMASRFPPPARLQFRMGYTTNNSLFGMIWLDFYAEELDCCLFLRWLMGKYFLTFKPKGLLNLTS